VGVATDDPTWLCAQSSDAETSQTEQHPGYAAESGSGIGGRVRPGDIDSMIYKYLHVESGPQLFTDPPRLGCLLRTAHGTKCRTDRFVRQPQVERAEVVL
jgi:hypothetical protein